MVLCLTLRYAVTGGLDQYTFCTSQLLYNYLWSYGLIGSQVKDLLEVGVNNIHFWPFVVDVVLSQVLIRSDDT